MLISLTSQLPKLAPAEDAPTEGFKGTPPVGDIDDNATDAPDAAPDDFASLADDLLADDLDDGIGDEVVDAKGDDQAESEVGEKQEEEAPVVEPEPVTKEGEPEPEPEPEPVAEQPPEPPVDYDTQRAKVVEEISKKFTFTDEQIEQLHDEPEKVLSNLAAELYVGVHEAIMQRVNALMPQMLTNVQTMQTASREAEQSFFKAWPALKADDAKHMQAIQRIGQTYRQYNPKASAEDFIREVGAQAMIALRMPLPKEYFDSGQEGGQETIPPHQPVQQPSAAAPIKPRNGNVFESLADEILEDDSL